MSEWKPKRFWKKVDVVSLEKSFCIKLDEKILKTPAKKEMLLPTKALAKKIALEWDKQVGEINPNSMPFTKSANAALDKVIEQFEEVSSLVSDYGDTDLLYYRADSPAELKIRQQSSWDPIIDWAEKILK